MESASEFFQQYAVGPVELIGQGMEGAVYDLGGELVGKSWFSRSAADVQPLRLFLDELAAQNLPFHTPQIHAVDEVDGRAVSIELKLHGTPLREAVEAGLVTQDRGFDIFVEVVAALATTHAGQATKALPVIGEAHPLRTPHRTTPADRPSAANHQPPTDPQPSSTGQQSSAAPQLFSAGQHPSTGARPSFAGLESWGEAVAGLVLRRALASRGHLEGDVEGFGELQEGVVGRLREIELDSPRIVHGDICTPNLLVNDAGETTALLDWGFLTTAGDTTFDAGTAAGFYDMYGPDAQKIDELLLDRFETELGHSRERMRLYRAAYAIITATIYSPDAADGHYKWCVANLNRPDLRAALR
jgi:hypothetical protein